MRPYVLFSASRSESSALLSVMDFLIKKRCEPQIVECIYGIKQLSENLQEPERLKMMICDATADGILPILEQLRQKNPDFRLVLVADNSISPVTYIRPTILPTALLWRPLQTGSIQNTLWEVLSTIPGETAQNTPGNSDGAFCVDLRGDIRRFPYSQILFFEASNKRLSLHTLRRELQFPGTLEKLAEKLPEEFIRVHKSYIVNRNAIAEIQFGQNTVVLEGGMMIPISRTYKSALKAVFS